MFFSYHFQRDAWRANQVRHSWIPHPDREAAGFFDAADQEEVKRQSEKAIKRWIDRQLQNTTVTAVLIGEETAERPYVQYEIEKSIERENGILGIRIDSLKNRHGKRGSWGENPLDHYYVDTGSGEATLSSIFPTYQWKENNGKENMSEWVEEAVGSASVIPASKRDTLEHKPDKETLGDLIVKGGMAAGGIMILAEVAKEIGDALRRNQFR
ncbi:TIR domain-containing protein [Haloferax massiliensis]|uniref:TIR domain-containing protein n=1 Tax=Haloferax massiliensis TaxID=1476858 RepID=UPI001428D5C8|nr:TIR domain-containing protein [Haloferax massiliensis]